MTCSVMRPGGGEAEPEAGCDLGWWCYDKGLGRAVLEVRLGGAPCLSLPPRGPRGALSHVTDAVLLTALSGL